MAETTRRYPDGEEGASDPTFRGRSGAGPRRVAGSFDSPTRGIGSPTPSIHEGDVRKRQEFARSTLFWLAYQSIGVIYGDIGTSPLYVYSSTFKSNPTYDDLLGVLSIIIWTLTLMVTVKYVLIVLLVDDEGEGGTFALYALLSRYANITARAPASARLIEMKRDDKRLRRLNMAFRKRLEDSAVARTVLKAVAVLGVCLMVADGILTPAQSVLGAVQGLSVVKHDISQAFITGISCVILILLFLVQRLGTSKIGGSFAPVVIIWLAVNLFFGIYNLAKHDYTVLKAFSPYFAGQYFVRHKTEAWKSLGGILLSFTGVEALYANLGAFNASSIRASWLAFVYPCLLFAYVGQAAVISKTPSAYSNPFFNSVPPGMLWPGIIISILAATVASEALITGTFQILSQAINLSYFPNVKVTHTSDVVHGHIYIPLANWFLMVITIMITATFGNTTKLGKAYGTCVALVVFITTCMVSIAAIVVWDIHPVFVLLGFLLFGSLDGLFLTSALAKVPQGAWLTLAMAAALSIFFLVWHYGKEQQWKAESQGRKSLNELVVAGAGRKYYVKSKREHEEVKLELVNIKGVGVFFDKVGEMSPMVYTCFIRKFQVLHELTIFVYLLQTTRPQVEPVDMYSIKRIQSLPDCFHITVRYGYNQPMVPSDLASSIQTCVRSYVASHGVASGVANGSMKPSETTNIETSVLGTAYDSQEVVYVIGREELKIVPRANIFLVLILKAFVWIRNLSRSKVTQMDVLPTDDLVEIGFVKEI